MGLMDSQVLVALALALLGGLSDSIGEGTFVVINQAPNLKMLGLLQGFAAGLMLSISFFDLAHNAINSIGFLKGNLWFFAGVIFLAVVANFITEPNLAPISDTKKNKTKGDEGGKDIMKKHRRQVLLSGIITAGLRVGLNLALAIALHNIPEAEFHATEVGYTFLHSFK
ncbi:Zinc transporter ztp29 [Orobanche gracilis]